MSRSRSMLVAGMLAIVAFALVATNGAGIQRLVGPRTALLIPAAPGAGGAQVATTPAAEPAAPAQVPASVPSGAASRVVATISVEPHQRVEQGYVLEARLLTRESKPINEAKVSFYDVRDLLGPREMLIGTATTDGQGSATVKYLPAEAGRHEIVARYVPSGQTDVVVTRTSFEADVTAKPSSSAEVLPLARVTAVLPAVAAAVLLAVWILFAFALIGTARGVRMATPTVRERKKMNLEDIG